MHATIEQLLSLRDGETTPAEIHDHVEDCDACRRELVRLVRIRDQLRALPAVEPDQTLWESIAVESLDRPTASRFSWGSAVGVAASFVLALVLITRMTPDPEAPAVPATQMSATQMSATPAPAAKVSDVVPANDAATVAELQTRSRRLETLRRAMPAGPEIVRASTAGTIADLQDQIAFVDMRLNAAQDESLTPAQQRALWRERVNLMQSLVRIEYARLQSPRY